jgi:uncharacterized protein YecT (DUF1311 family)
MIAALFLAASYPRPDCASPKFGWEIAECSDRDFKRADLEMNKQWQTVLKAMQKRDKQIDRKTGRAPLFGDTLLASQRAWLVFRDQHCLLVSFDARGGNSTQLVLDNSCKAQLTKARTEQLKSLLD